MLLLILITMMLPEEVIAIPLSLVIGDLPVAHVSLKGTLLGVILLLLIVAADPSDYTLTVALLSLRSDDQVGPGIVLAGALLALVPSLLVYLSLQKSFLRGITTGAIKG